MPNAVLLADFAEVSGFFGVSGAFSAQAAKNKKTIQ
jgi:hypothetical protein